MVYEKDSILSHSILLCLLFAPINSLLFASDSPESVQALRFFEQEVRPLLVDHCFECHGEDKQKAGLRLDARVHWLAGSQNGPVVEPGHPDNSLLIGLVEGRDPKLRMPPKGESLTEKEVFILRTWLEMGLPWTGQDEKSELPSLRKGDFTDEDRNYWAFQPIQKSTPPSVKDPSWCRNEIDAFILSKLETKGLSPSKEAGRLELLRRLTFNLHGLPPSKEEVDSFLVDTAPDAYEKRVHSLLESPRYGEKWARHWLDLVRYAESDGFRADHERPEAWRYRDYVVRSLNEDKPYDRFVLEQLAADEITPGQPETLVATGFLRHGLYEYNQRHISKQWNEMLDEMTDVTGDVFLGLGMACARCHDHKFDPILRKDYYRLRAFFAPVLPREDMDLATTEQWMEHESKMRQWEEATTEIRAQIQEIERPVDERYRKSILNKFDPDFRVMALKPIHERSPLEHQLAGLIDRQVVYEEVQTPARIKGDAKEPYQVLLDQLKGFDPLKPKPLPKAFIVTDVGPSAPPTTIPGSRQNDPIAPGFLSILDPDDADIVPVPSAPNSTGRRTALARWITDKENPLTARVMVNRIWQYHFGAGLVSSSSDFGRLGKSPSHPELLDWLASRFIEEGWSWKVIHELILNSATYRQTSHIDPARTAHEKDPGNRFLWRMNPRRLQAEEIRDAILFVSGELDLHQGGPPVKASTPRRTLYTQQRRNTREVLMDVFDLPLGIRSTAKRHVTTTPSQALLLLNSSWSNTMARQLAGTVRNQTDLDLEQKVALIYSKVFSREPSHSEIDQALVFLEKQKGIIKAGPTVQAETSDPEEKAFSDLAHALLNSNEFLYID